MVKIVCTPRKRVIPNVPITSPAPPPPASIAIKKEFLRKLRNLRGREIIPSHVLDWELAIENGLDKQLEPLSRQECTEGGFVKFLDTAWWKIFHINEPTYTELVLEFLSTLNVDKLREEGTPDIISFWLNGIERECSLMEFAERIELYTPQVARSHEFCNFISQCCRKFLPEFNATTFWPTIGDGYYSRFDRFEGHIRSPAHRMLH